MLARPLLITFSLVSLFSCLPSQGESAGNSFDARLARAEKARLANDYPRALGEYSSLVKVRPADSRMHANYGWVLVQAGQMPLAKEEIGKALALNDQDPSAHQALALYYMFNNDKESARREYIKTIALDPKRNCHCGGIQKYLGITPDDEKKAFKEAASHGRMPKPVKPK